MRNLLSQVITAGEASLAYSNPRSRNRSAHPASTALPRGSAALWWTWFAMGLASLAVLLYSGSQFFVGMWQGLKHRSANMHTLIALGTSVAWLYSTVALFFPQLFPSAEMADVYYDVTVVVTALVVLGLAMELKAKGRTSEAIKKLIGLQAKTARVVRDGREQDIPVEDLQAIAAPALVIAGDQDSVTAQHTVELFLALGGGVPGDLGLPVPKAQLAILPNTTHIQLVFVPEPAINAIVPPFLDAPLPDATATPAA